MSTIVLRYRSESTLAELERIQNEEANVIDEPRPQLARGVRKHDS